MKGRLFLSGGGNEKQTHALDEIFLKNIERILYIPIAWPNEDFNSCLKWFINLMDKHKKKEIKIDILTDLSKKINLNNYDAVYIGGGNTFKLLKKIKDNGFGKKLIEYYNNDGTIYGGSAGAIIFGRDIDTALICKDKDVNKVKLRDTTGLNLVKDTYIQCHFEDNQIDEHKDFMINKKAKAIICIPEESALMIQDRKYKVIGLKPITVISKQKTKKYNVGEYIS